MKYNRDSRRRRFISRHTVPPQETRHLRATVSFVISGVILIATIGVAGAAPIQRVNGTPVRTGTTIQRPRVSGATGSYLYIADFNAAEVSVLDTSTNVVVATIPVGNSPEDVVVDTSRTYAYVSNEGSDTVSVISTASNTG